MRMTLSKALPPLSLASSQQMLCCSECYGRPRYECFAVGGVFLLGGGLAIGGSLADALPP
jgi:hypothetical protein